MARFYVVQGRRALWNLLVITMVVLALVYVFRTDDLGQEAGVSVQDDPGQENLVVVEPVTVRPVPTKYAEYKLERERMRSRQIEFLQSVAYDPQSDSEQHSFKTSCRNSLPRWAERQNRAC